MGEGAGRKGKRKAEGRKVMLGIQIKTAGRGVKGGETPVTFAAAQVLSGQTVGRARAVDTQMTWGR